MFSRMSRLPLLKFLYWQPLIKKTFDIFTLTTKAKEMLMFEH